MFLQTCLTYQYKQRPTIKREKTLKALRQIFRSRIFAPHSWRQSRAKCNFHLSDRELQISPSAENCVAWGCSWSPTQMENPKGSGERTACRLWNQSQKETCYI